MVVFTIKTQKIVQDPWYNSPGPWVTSSTVLFCPTNSSNPELTLFVRIESSKSSSWRGYQPILGTFASQMMPYSLFLKYLKELMNQFISSVLVLYVERQKKSSLPGLWSQTCWCWGIFLVWSFASLSLCFQVRLRFKKFLKVLFKQMLDEHGWSRPDASASGASGAGGSASGTTAAAAASDVALGGSADDGLQGVSVHALAVSHGAYIRVAIKHLVEDLNCSLPAGVKMSHLFSPCPNTGVNRFILTLRQSESGPVLSAARCVFTNRKDHLVNLTAAE